MLFQALKASSIEVGQYFPSHIHLLPWAENHPNPELLQFPNATPSPNEDVSQLGVAVRSIFSSSGEPSSPAVLICLVCSSGFAGTMESRPSLVVDILGAEFGDREAFEILYLKPD